MLPILTQLRNKGISCEIYPDSAKMKKQMTYANNMNAHFVAIIGENEMMENKITLKNMITGEQQTVSLEEMVSLVVKK